MDFDSDATFGNTTFKNNLALESGGCVAEDGESNTTYYGTTLFLNNSARWDGGCLYSGSGVGPSDATTITQGFFFYDNVTFKHNHLLNNDKGQNNIYIWSLNIIYYYFMMDLQHL